MKSDIAPKPATRKRRGSGRATIHDVARQAGVGSITVSRFLKQPDLVSAERSSRIVAAIKKLNYVPNMVAGGLASTRGRIVGMVIPNISGPIFANTIQGFSDVLTQYGYQLLLASSSFSVEKEEDIVRALLGWSPAALVLTSRYHTKATEKLVNSAGIPIVETWDYQARRKPIQVGFSHVEVGRQAATYLYQQGYRRIAFVQNSISGDFSAIERSDGYAEVMRAHGLTPNIVIPTAAAPFDAGKEALETLTHNKKKSVDAIIFANDNLAAGAVLAAQRNGVQIPQQCAVVGFGDYQFSSLLLPSLTTIRPPAWEMGEIAALRILESLGEIDTEQAVQRLNLLQCELLVREST